MGKQLIERIFSLPRVAKVRNRFVLKTEVIGAEAGKLSALSHAQADRQNPVTDRLRVNANTDNQVLARAFDNVTLFRLYTCTAFCGSLVE